MRQTIDQPARGHLTHATKIVRVDCVDVAPGKLPLLARAVEHPRGLQVVHGAEHKIETVPVTLHPCSARRPGHGIIVEFDPGADGKVRIFFPEAVQLVEVNPLVVAVVIGERDVAQSFLTRGVRPRLEQRR